MEKADLKNLAEKFAELNPSLLRDIMESHFIRFSNIEFSQGKFLKGQAEKHYKSTP